jgi:hypothetical protein
MPMDFWLKVQIFNIYPHTAYIKSVKVENTHIIEWDYQTAKIQIYKGEGIFKQKLKDPRIFPKKKLTSTIREIEEFYFLSVNNRTALYAIKYEFISSLDKWKTDNNSNCADAQAIFQFAVDEEYSCLFHIDDRLAYSVMRLEDKILVNNDGDFIYIPFKITSKPISTIFDESFTIKGEDKEKLIEITLPTVIRLIKAHMFKIPTTRYLRIELMRFLRNQIYKDKFSPFRFLVSRIGKLKILIIGSYLYKNIERHSKLFNWILSVSLKIINALINSLNVAEIYCRVTWHNLKFVVKTSLGHPLYYLILFGQNKIEKALQNIDALKRISIIPGNPYRFSIEPSIDIYLDTIEKSIRSNMYYTKLVNRIIDDKKEKITLLGISFAAFGILLGVATLIVRTLYNEEVILFILYLWSIILSIYYWFAKLFLMMNF